MNDRKQIFRFAPYLAVAGLVLIGVAIIFRLGWPVYLPGVLALALAASIALAEQRGGTESVTAILVFPVIVAIGIVATHPQGWSGIGKDIGTGDASILGRSTNCALVRVKNHVTCMNLNTEVLEWHHRVRTDATIAGDLLLIREPAHPKIAKAFGTSSGVRKGTAPWPQNVVAAVKGRSVSEGGYSVSLSDVRDLAGNKWTKMTVHSPTGVDTYRVNGVDQIQLLDGLLLMSGPTSNRLLVLLANEKKGSVPTSTE